MYIIVDGKQRLSTMFDFIERGYDSFYELEEGPVKVMDKLRSIYSKDIPIEEKIFSLNPIPKKVLHMVDFPT